MATKTQPQLSQQQAEPMRKFAPLISPANRMLTLLVKATNLPYWAPMGLVVASALGAVMADDAVSKDKPNKPPATSASIELELQPSAPEAIESAKTSVAAPQTTDPPSLELSSSRSSREKAVKRDSTSPAAAMPLELARRTTEPPPRVAKNGEMVEKKKETAAEQEKTPAKLNSQPSQELKRDTKSTDLKSQRTTASSAKLSDGQIDRDFSNERLDSDEIATSEMSPEPDDLPLDQVEHPFDAPAAKPTERKSITQKPSAKRNAAPGATPAIDSLESTTQSFSARELRIKAEIQQCLDYYLTHPENTTRRGPWALMHTILPYGVESEVIAGGRRVNTIGWLSFNGTCGKQNLFQPTRTGFRPVVGPGVQGHEGQFLAILAQSQVKADYPLQINRRRYTVMDLARYEMATCREGSELTFKLIGLSYYLEPNQRWRDNRGRNWTLEKMVAEELAQPINGAACGGVHRLMGLSFSLVQRQEAGQPIIGNWQRAETYLNDYINYAMSLQNPDGSFSTNWLESRGMDPDVERKVQTTGHILEWIVYTLPDEYLRSPKVQLALEFLLDSVGREPQKDWPIGPRGHALRAMALYSQRVYGAEVGQMQSFVAAGRTSSKLR